MTFAELKELAKNGTFFFAKLHPEFFNISTERCPSGLSVSAEMQCEMTDSGAVHVKYKIEDVLNPTLSTECKNYLQKIAQSTSTGYSSSLLILTDGSASHITMMNICSTEGCVQDITGNVFLFMKNRYLPVLKFTDKVPEQNPLDPFSPEHLAWMLCELVDNNTMSETKKHRWLGYVQGVMAVLGLITVSTERDETREFLNGK